MIYNDLHKFTPIYPVSVKLSKTHLQLQMHQKLDQAVENFFFTLTWIGQQGVRAQKKGCIPVAPKVKIGLAWTTPQSIFKSWISGFLSV